MTEAQEIEQEKKTTKIFAIVSTKPHKYEYGDDQINLKIYDVIGTHQESYKTGIIVHIGIYEDEDACWRVYLGFPTRGEVRRKKAEGYECHHVLAKTTFSG